MEQNRPKLYCLREKPEDGIGVRSTCQRVKTKESNSILPFGAVYYYLIIVTLVTHKQFI